MANPKRAILVLFIAFVLACSAHIIYYGLARAWRSMVEALLFQLAQGLAPSAVLFVWLLVDRRPTWRKAVGIISVVFILQSVALGVWIAGLESALDQSYALLAYGPVLGGTIGAVIAYALSNLLVDHREYFSR